MPEGPSIVILREEVEALGIVGQKLIKAEGNTKIDKESLEGQKVVEIKSWGKHFLIRFDKVTLKIHFMLFGSYRLNERKESPARLSLQFKDAEINFYACSVKLLEGPLEKIYDWSTDIMAKEWKPRTALKKLREKPDMMVCDALLDQNIFAGSGNIIKNEVLFRIRVHPLSLVGKLSDGKLRELVTETRNYSFDFLKWKKEFTLKKHWLAHTKKICPRCNIPFLKDHLGKHKRRSFFCLKCQKLYE